MALRRWVLRAVGASICAAVLYLGALWLTTPSVRPLETANPRDTAFSRARGQALGEWTPLESVSPLAVCAVVKAEDRNFFHHHGFEWTRLRDAVSDHRSGTSTLTQQLAKNLFFGPEPTLHRKLREAFTTRALEHTLSKRRILALYLNVIELGDGVWGIGDGARRLFGTSPAQLGAFESALLAGLIAAPRAPLQGRNLERLQRVYNQVLQQLYFSRLIDQDAWIDADERGRRLFALVRGGRSLRQAIDETAPGSRPPAVAPANALDTECGLARQLEATGLFRSRLQHR